MLRMTLGELRRLIREGLDTEMRNMAGFFGGGGISKSDAAVEEPVPGLGDEDTEDTEQTDRKYGKEKPTQRGARFGQGRQD